MYNFEYHRPASLDDAAKLLGNEDAKLVAGGMTLIPTLKLRLAKPSQLIDLGAIPALKGLGVRHVEMPATPEKLWRLIHQHQPRAAAE